MSGKPLSNHKDRRADTSTSQPFESAIVSNTLLDIVGPLVLGPLVAAVFWGSAPPQRIVLAAGTHLAATLTFGVILWWIGRHRAHHYAVAEEVWVACVAGVAGAFPWLLRPEGSAGHALLALIFTALLASDTLFLAVRPNRWWRSIALFELSAYAGYLFLVGAWVIAVFCIAFGVHALGGHRAIQDLVVLLRRERTASEHRARTDYLTGLNNRRGMAVHLDEIASQGTAADITVASIDIDNFKQINDQYGHVGGDQALVALSNQLSQLLGDEWFLVRAGGDEFFAVCEGRDGDDVERALCDLHVRVLGEASVPLTLSAGVASGPVSDDVWKDASAALRIAKQMGKSQVVIVDDALQDDLRVSRDVAGRLAEAINERRIGIWAQPIVNAGDFSVHSYECLARWVEPNGQLIPPNVFIPMVEDQNLTRNLGESVIEQALQFAEVVPDGVSVAVNISASHFADESFVPFVMRAIGRMGVAPSALTVEITESEYFANQGDRLSAARQLRELGVGLSIDDFGTGYSSLERLMQMPFSQLKLDRMIVEALSTSATKHLVAGLAHFARAGDIELVAEGIETERQCRQLEGLGVPLVQGFHFARPRPVNEIAHDYVAAQFARPGTWQSRQIPAPSRQR